VIIVGARFDWSPQTSSSIVRIPISTYDIFTELWLGRSGRRWKMLLMGIRKLQLLLIWSDQRQPRTYICTNIVLSIADIPSTTHATSSRQDRLPLIMDSSNIRPSRLNGPVTLTHDVRNSDLLKFKNSRAPLSRWIGWERWMGSRHDQGRLLEVSFRG